MITCVVAQFRTNHRNSHIFSVCLDPLSPPVFRLAFVEGLCTVLKEVRKLTPEGVCMCMYMYVQYAQSLIVRSDIEYIYSRCLIFFETALIARAALFRN